LSSQTAFEDRRMPHITSSRTYHASDRYPLLTGAIAAATLLAMGLVLTFMLGSVMQWRSGALAQSQLADAARAESARMIQVGSLR